MTKLKVNKECQSENLILCFENKRKINRFEQHQTQKSEKVHFGVKTYIYINE